MNGTYVSKLEKESFLNTVKDFDIFCLQETHTAENDVPTLENFVPIPHCRNISGNKRYFGGMILYVKRTIRKGIKKLMMIA